MRDLTFGAAGSRLRFRSSHRIAPLRISHRGPSAAAWQPPTKDVDRDAPGENHQTPRNPHAKKGKRQAR